MAITKCLYNIDEHGLELVIHGNTSFPVVICYDDLNEESVEWHWHQKFEFLLLAEADSFVTAGTEKSMAVDQHNTGCRDNSCSLLYLACYLSFLDGITKMNSKELINSM